MNKFKYFLWALPFCLIWSCTDVLQLDEFETDSFPVVIGFLSPQMDTLEVYVGQSLSLNESIDHTAETAVIKHAYVVLINENGQQAILSYHAKKAKYQIASTAFPIVEGATYDLEVSIENKRLHAQCQIPKSIPSFDIEVVEVQFSSYLRLAWQDAKDVTNFYQLKAFYQGVSEFEIGWNENCDILESFMKDGDLDGQIIHSPLGYLNNKGCRGANFNQTGDSIQIEVAQLDEASYRYYTSVYQALASTALSDPVRIYSNIEGGQGVFGAFSSRQQQFIWH